MKLKTKLLFIDVNRNKDKIIKFLTKLKIDFIYTDLNSSPESKIDQVDLCVVEGKNYFKFLPLLGDTSTVIFAKNVDYKKIFQYNVKKVFLKFDENSFLEILLESRKEKVEKELALKSLKISHILDLSREMFYIDDFHSYYSLVKNYFIKEKISGRHNYIINCDRKKGITKFLPHDNNNEFELFLEEMSFENLDLINFVENAKLKKFSYILINSNVFYVIYLGSIGPVQYYLSFFASSEHISNKDYFLNLTMILQESFIRISNGQKLNYFKKLSYHDEITGLYNARKLTIDLKYLERKYKNDLKGFVVLFIDIDHFKKVNDSYGHLVGTQMIKEVAIIIQDLLRNNDYCYRYGGDEYIVIIPESSLDVGHFIAERILTAIKERDFFVQEKLIKISVSIGLAEYPADAQSSIDIIKKADEFMYVAKKKGRGTVHHEE